MFRTYFLVYAIIASHSFVVAALLASRRTNVGANRYLAVINGLIGLIAIFAFVSFETDFRYSALFVYVIIPFVFIFTPLTYAYGKQLTKRPTRRLPLHYLPAAAAIAYAVVRGASEGAPATVEPEELFTLYFVPADTYFVLQFGLALMIGYFIAMLVELARYDRGLRQTLSNVSSSNLTWFRVQLSIATASVAVYFITNLIQYFHVVPNHPVLLWLEYIALSGILAFLLLVVYFTFRQGETREVHPRERPQYARQRLTDTVELSYADQLVKAMEGDQVYLDPDLTIDDLSRRLDIPTAHLTMVLSLRLGKSFYQFINHYRLKHACRLLRDSAYAGRSILDIAMESGFNSKTSFNTSFKREQGVTPREYRRAAVELIGRNTS